MLLSLLMGLIVIGSFILGTFFGGLFSLEEKNTLTIVHVGDTHLAYSEDQSKGKLGFSGLFTLLSYLKKNNSDSPMIFVDAGDTFHGNPYGDLTKGNVAINLWKKIQEELEIPVYQNLGNHDFDWGIKPLQNRKIGNAKLSWPIMSANVLQKEDKKPVINKNPRKEYQLIKTSLNDKLMVKIGMFGLMTPTLTQWAPHSVADNIIISDPTKASLKATKFLKEKGADVILGVGHLGYSYPGVKKSGTSIGVMKKNSDIDFFIDSHSHVASQIYLEDGRLISNVGSYLTNIGITELSFIGKKLVSVNDRLIGFEGVDNLKKLGVIKKDRETEKFAEEIKTVDKELKKLAERTKITNQDKVPYELKYSLSKRKEGDLESKIGNFSARAARNSLHADLALIHNSVIKDSLGTGKIMKSDLFRIWDQAQFVYQYKLKGDLIKSLLEKSMIAPSAGISFEFSKVNFKWNGEDKKISEITINKEPLDLEKEYTLATTIFKDSIPTDTDWYFTQIPGLDKALSEMTDNSRSYFYEMINEFLQTNNYDFNLHKNLRSHIDLS